MIMQPIDSRIGRLLTIASLALLCGCTPLLMWNRDYDDLGLADQAKQPASELPLPIDDPSDTADRSGSEVGEVATKQTKPASSSEKTASAKNTTVEKSESSEFVDQLRGGNELTAEEQRTIEKLMEKSPDAARFLASRNSDPTVKNLAALHGESVPTPPEGSSDGIDLLREGRTLPAPDLGVSSPPPAVANSYPPQARLGAPGPLEEPAEMQAIAAHTNPAQPQLPVVEYGQGSQHNPSAPGYGGRLPPQQQLRPGPEAYAQGAPNPAKYPPTTASQPNMIGHNPYQAAPAYPPANVAGGYPPAQTSPPGGYQPPHDPRMIINHHVQQPQQSYDQVAPVGYNAAYPDTSFDEPAALTGLPRVEEEAVQTPEPADWRKSLEQAIAALESELLSAQHGPEAATDESLEEGEPHRLSPLQKQDIAHLDAQLRMLYLAGGMRDAAVTPVEYYDADQQEFWKYAMNGLSVYLDREKHPVDDRRLRLALRDLRQAVAQLASGSSLDVHNLAFCSKVDSFGSYQEFPDYDFTPGQEVLLYVEVENFTSERKADAYETSLVGSYRIFNAQKNRVADHTFIEETETCRNQRRDYFITYRMWMPKDIAPGQYTLQLTLEDLKGNKSGQASLRFNVAK